MIDIIHGNTSADTFTAAARAGYLFDAGPVRAGPIAGLNYTLASIQGYTETGDSLLTMIVNEQNVDSLTGNAGLQVRFPFELGGDLYSPFINVTAEHDFLGSGRVVTTTQETAPLLPVLPPFPARAALMARSPLEWPRELAGLSAPQSTLRRHLRATAETALPSAVD